MSTGAPTLASRARAITRTPHFLRLIRYASASAITTVLALGLLYVFYRGVKLVAWEANVIATVITTIPSYYLNRAWTWGKSGKSHLWREVVPFWVIAFVSLALSTGAVYLAAHSAHRISDRREVQTILVEAANLTTYAILWIAKYVFFNKVLFKHEPVPSIADDGEGFGGDTPAPLAAGAPGSAS